MEIGISIASFTTILLKLVHGPTRRNMQMLNRCWKLQDGMTKDEAFDIEATEIFCIFLLVSGFQCNSKEVLSPFVESFFLFAVVVYAYFH